MSADVGGPLNPPQRYVWTVGCRAHPDGACFETKSQAVALADAAMWGGNIHLRAIPVGEP